MTDWISPTDRARMPGGVQDRLRDLESGLQTQQQKDAQAQSLAKVSVDPWATNASFPSICQGRLTTVSGNPIPFPFSANGDVVYFTNYQGNLVGMYNGSHWAEIPFSELSLPIRGTQSGTTTNGSAVITGLVDTSQLVVGMVVQGTGIPGTATISTIDSDTQITMSVNATASGTVSIVFAVTPNRNFDIFIVDTGNGVLALRLIMWTTPPNAAITNVTNASPMVVTVASTAALGVGPATQVTIRNVAGATGANGTWRVGTVTATTFQLLNDDGTNSAAGGAYTSGGNAQLTLFSSTSNTRVSPISLQDGIYVLTSDPTWRYLGTGHASSTILLGSNQAILWNTTARYLWNYYNRKQLSLINVPGVASYNVSVTNTWQPDANNIANRVEFVIGVVEDEVVARKVQSITVSNSAIALTSLAVAQWDISFTTTPIYEGRVSNAAATTINAAATVDGILQASYSIQPGFLWVGGQSRANSTVNAIYVVSTTGVQDYALIVTLWG